MSKVSRSYGPGQLPPLPRVQSLARCFRNHLHIDLASRKTWLTDVPGLDDVVVQMALQAKDGAVANVTVDKGSVAGWGKEGGADCPDNLKARRIIASMGFCVPN